MALLRAREAVMRQFRPSLRRHGITEQQWRVLRALTTVDRIEILALAQATCLLPPSLSRILKDLEERRFVVRRASPNDLRSSFISIAPKGHKLIEQAGVESEAIYAEIAQRFGPQRMAMLYDLLAQLETDLKGLAIADAPSPSDEP
jgi:homoprotocatechuate degradation regulator HpaR